MLHFFFNEGFPYPEVGFKRAASIIAEFSDVKVILVHNVDMASNLMRMCLEEGVLMILDYYQCWNLLVSCSP